MIIESGRVVFENANRPHGYGLIRPETFSPFPKNPKIARVFKEIGLADELGSGVRNLFSILSAIFVYYLAENEKGQLHIAVNRKK